MGLPPIKQSRLPFVMAEIMNTRLTDGVCRRISFTDNADPTPLRRGQGTARTACVSVGQTTTRHDATTPKRHTSAHNQISTDQHFHRLMIKKLQKCAVTGK